MSGDEGEDEGKDSREDGESGEAKLGSELAHVSEQVEEGEMHERVGDEHDEDIGRIGLGDELPEASDEGPGGVGDPTHRSHLAEPFVGLSSGGDGAGGEQTDGRGQVGEEVIEPELMDGEGGGVDGEGEGEG